MIVVFGIRFSMIGKKRLRESEVAKFVEVKDKESCKQGMPAPGHGPAIRLESSADKIMNAIQHEVLPNCCGKHRARIGELLPPFPQNLTGPGVKLGNIY